MLSHLKNGYPGIANVIKINGPFVWIQVSGLAYVVELIQVTVVPVPELWEVEVGAVDFSGDVLTLQHAVVAVLRANERVLLCLVHLVVRL